MSGLGVVGSLGPAVLRRDGVGTVVDLPPMSFNAASVRDGDTRWHVWSWVPMDPPPTDRYRSVAWQTGHSRGHRPPPELVVGDVIEFARISKVDGREVFRVRWFGLCEGISPQALTVVGGYQSLVAAIAASADLVALTHTALLEADFGLPDVGGRGDGDALGYGG